LLTNNKESVDKLEEFDADPNVFVCIAHDEGLAPLPKFPKSTLNEWKKKGWKEASQWGFLNALPIEGRSATDWFVPGLMKEGKRMVEWEQYNA
jgi:hypothetical protein